MLHDALYSVTLHATPVTHEDLKCGVHRSGRCPLVVEGALVHTPTSIFLARLTAVRFEERADRKDRPLSLVTSS